MDTSSRLLRLLALMSSRPTWRARDLAERLEVTERSIRRDITRLRDLGYPVESVTGPYGGYSLGAGGRLPPLLLDDDEAVSIAVALHDVARKASPALADGALSALTKLGQVMPMSLRERVAALSSVVVDIAVAADPFADAAPSHVQALMVLALACARAERVRFDYRAGDGTESMRHAEPYRMVPLGQRWYLVANDIDRKDWRTFRVDRMTRVTTNGSRFVRGETPDAAALVAAGVAVNAYSERALVRVYAAHHVVMREVPATIGVPKPEPRHSDRTLVEIGGEPEWVARYLAGLPFRFDVLETAAVRDALRELGTRLARDNA